MKSDLSFKRYSDEVAENINSNPKEFFNFVIQRKKSGRFPSSMKFGDFTFSNPKEISDTFARFFSSVYDSTLIRCSPETPTNSSLDLNSIKFLSIDRSGV